MLKILDQSYTLQQNVQAAFLRLNKQTEQNHCIQHCLCKKSEIITRSYVSNLEITLNKDIISRPFLQINTFSWPIILSFSSGPLFCRN